MVKAGVELRVIKPSTAGYASQHAKSWTIDGIVLLTGSVNLTKGGFENNLEHCVISVCKATVREAQFIFEEAWKCGEPVTEQEIGEVVAEARMKRERVNARYRCVGRRRTQGAETE